jgi:hypothetical protein
MIRKKESIQPTHKKPKNLCAAKIVKKMVINFKGFSRRWKT